MSRLSQNITNEGKEKCIKFPGKQTIIDVPDPVSPFQICKPPRVQDTSSSLIGPSQISANKAQQTAPCFEIDNSWTTSHSNQQHIPPATVVQSETPVPDLRPELKIGCLVILISAGGILAVQAALRGERREELTRDVLFKAYTVLNYISLVLGLALFLLSVRRSNILHLDMIIKLTMWISLGSITYALACATSIILAENLVEVILVLLTPLVMVVLLISFSFCGPKSSLSLV